MESHVRVLPWSGGFEYSTVGCLPGKFMVSYRIR
jgi:hypothetical protein